jgi:hypothetical protein
MTKRKQSPFRALPLLAAAAWALACASGGQSAGGPDGTDETAPVDAARPTPPTPRGEGGAGGSAPADAASGSGGARATEDAAPAGAADSSASAADTGGAPGAGPAVDRSKPQAFALAFKASDADPAATKLLGDQQAFLDTRVAPQGTLVVHLHGSGEKTTCGYADHGRLLASFGFHVFMPCYDAAVSWSNSGCGGAVGDCRLEMLDGMDHDGHLAIAPPQAIEVRVAKALAHLTKTNPEGDWGYFLDGDKPRWSRIIISGQSFGATSSLLIAKHRAVVRAVSLSGPLDGGAAWLKAPSMTPLDRMYVFTHVNDGQHPSHMSSMNAIGLPGTPVNVEMAMPPYGGSHRLVGAQTTYNGAQIDGHNATEARMQSPRDAQTGKWLYEPVWRYMYGLPPGNLNSGP